jgi:polar amino acid transport system substrate-binding protein
MKKTLVIVGIFVCLILPILAINVRASDTSLTDVKTAGKIVVGTNSGYPPFETVDPSTNKIVGFDADIAQIIATNLSVSVDWRDVSFDTLVTSLALGQFDIVIAAMTITPERAAQVNFTRWYFNSSQAVMVTVANPKHILSVNDINATVKVGVETATTSDWYMQDQGLNDTGFNSINLAIQALSSGSVDAVLGDNATLQYAMQTQPGKFLIVDYFSNEYFGIAVRPGAYTLLNQINDILNTLLGSNVSAPVYSDQYNQLITKWFNQAESSTVDGFPIMGLACVVSITLVVLIKKLRKN